MNKIKRINVLSFFPRTRCKVFSFHDDYSENAFTLGRLYIWEDRSEVLPLSVQNDIISWVVLSGAFMTNFNGKISHG